jgi:hypothetical protein
MKLESLLQREESFGNYIGRDKPIDERYPKRYLDEGGGGYAIPSSDLMESIIWVWLKWQIGRDIKSIQDVLRPVINRSMQMISDTKMANYFREDHDHFLIQLAVLSGNKELRYAVAMSVQEATEFTEKYQYYQAWTGILKYRILGEEKQVQKQYEIMQRSKALRYYLFPTKKEIESFVKKDYKALFKAIKQRSEQFWKFAEQWKAIKEENGEKILDVKKFYLNLFWPWVECTFAKLAYLDGAEMKYNSIWLPLDLVKAIEK